MSSSPSVGFDAGWSVEFRPARAGGTGAPVLTVDRAGYDAEIRVEFDAAFRAPTFTVAIDGLHEDDISTITSTPLPILTIRMGWRDQAASFGGGFIPVANALGLGEVGASSLPVVLTGRVRSYERTVGDYRYRTTFTGVDLTWARLAGAVVGDTQLPANGSLARMIEALCRAADPAIRVQQEGAAVPLSATPEPAKTAHIIEAIDMLARAGYPGTSDRSPLLVRDGVVHVGTWDRAVTDGKTHELTEGTGLVEAKPAPFHHETTDNDNPYAPALANAYTLTLLGRADIKPGDAVQAALPAAAPSAAATAAGILGGLGALGVMAAPIVSAAVGSATATSEFRVTGVTHQLAPNVGFISRLTVVGVGSGPERPSATGEAHLAAQQLDERMRALGRTRRTIDVGRISGQTVQSSGSNHAQRVGVRSGLADTEPPNLPVRAAVHRGPTLLLDKPYLTPFAFGGTGLVIPHYPGTRVVHLNHEGDVHNAFVAGALWTEGEEPRSQVGDWWLTLPIGVSPAASGQVDRPNPQGKVSSDLTDANGHRSIRTRGLELTVGSANLPAVGERLMGAADDELTIVAAAGNARITIESDGKITIHTDQELHIEAKKVVMQTQDGVEVT